MDIVKLKKRKVNPVKEPSKDTFTYRANLVVKSLYQVTMILNGAIFSVVRKEDNEKFSVGETIYCPYTHNELGQIETIWQLGDQLWCNTAGMSLTIAAHNHRSIITSVPY